MVMVEEKVAMDFLAVEKGVDFLVVEVVEEVVEEVFQ